MSFVVTIVFGWLYLYVSEAHSSRSIASGTLNPAISKPKLKPPHPANKSITFRPLFGLNSKISSTLQHK